MTKLDLTPKFDSATMQQLRQDTTRDIRNALKSVRVKHTAEILTRWRKTLKGTWTTQMKGMFVQRTGAARKAMRDAADKSDWIQRDRHTFEFTLDMPGKAGFYAKMLELRGRGRMTASDNMTVPLPGAYLAGANKPPKPLKEFKNTQYWAFGKQTGSYAGKKGMIVQIRGKQKHPIYLIRRSIDIKKDTPWFTLGIKDAVPMLRKIAKDVKASRG